jgi:hypothetical protein
MRQLCLTLRVKEPLVISDGSSESMGHRSLDYIPGNMLLGALANRWLSLNPDIKGKADNDKTFQSLFLDGSVSWGHAYPLVGDSLAQPIPLCFSRIKTGSDLPTMGLASSNSAPSFIVNSLTWNKTIDDLASLSGQERPKIKKCRSGFWDSDGSHLRPSQRSYWATHVALDPKERRAIDGLLFGFSSIAEGGRLASLILVSDEKAEALKDLLNNTKAFMVGHGRSAGYGKVEVESVVEKTLSPPAIQDPKVYRIFLESDYLPQNSWKNPVDSLLEELAPYIVCSDKGSIKIYAQSVEIAGFNNLWRLPRPTRLGLAKGSVIELEASGAGQPQKPWPFRFGSGTTEGYGRIRLNPPFLTKEYFQVEAKDQELKDQKARDTIAKDQGPLKAKAQGQDSSKAQSVLNIIHLRAIDREIQRIIVELLYGKTSKFCEFAKSLGGAKLSPSQLGKLRNLIAAFPRRMWLDFFTREMEKKTISKKWRQGSAINPFPGPKREYLDVIMKKLLSEDFPLKLFEVGKVELKLPGRGPLSKDNKDYFSEKFHREFLLQLLALWRQKARAKD